MSRRFVCFFFFPSIFRQWNREEGRYRRSCIPRLIGSIESRQKFLACPQKSNIPALGSSSASFASLHMFARAPARTHAYFRNRGSRFFIPFVHSIFPLPSSFFPSPPLRVNRRRRRCRRYVVFARCFHRFRLIDALPPE